MIIAMRYPDLVGKLVPAGGVTYSPDGTYPELAEGMDKLKPEDLAGSPFEAAYAKMAPNPENWPALIDKVSGLDVDFAGGPPEEIQAIKAPTLLIIGDADICRPEHVVETFRLLEGGVPGDLYGLSRSRLAVPSGTTHITLVHRADWLISMAGEFLDAPATEGE